MFIKSSNCQFLLSFSTVLPHKKVHLFMRHIFQISYLSLSLFLTLFLSLSLALFLFLFLSFSLSLSFFFSQSLSFSFSHYLSLSLFLSVSFSVSLCLQFFVFILELALYSSKIGDLKFNQIYKKYFLFQHESQSFVEPLFSFQLFLWPKWPLVQTSYL